VGEIIKKLNVTIKATKHCCDEDCQYRYLTRRNHYYEIIYERPCRQYNTKLEYTEDYEHSIRCNKRIEDIMTKKIKKSGSWIEKGVKEYLLIMLCIIVGLVLGCLISVGLYLLPTDIFRIVVMLLAIITIPLLMYLYIIYIDYLVKNDYKKYKEIK